MILEAAPILVLIYVLVPALLSVLLLYVVVRFGVKHGMRSYYAEAEPDRPDGSV